MSNTNEIRAKAPTVTTLEELGLAKNEAVLYNALLNTVDATIPYLVKNTPFSRTLLYYLLGNLEAYELVTASKNGSKTVYNVEPPDKLGDMLQNREKEFQKQKDLLKNVMGDLYSTYRLAHNKPGVKFYEGLDGIKEVTFDSLKATETIYTFIDIEAIGKYAQEMNDAYVKERVKRGIHKKQICLDTPYTRERYKKNPPPDRLLEIKLLPPALNPFKTSVQIYNDTVSYSTLTADTQIGVIMTDKNISQMHRSLFEYIWSTLPSPAVIAP